MESQPLIHDRNAPQPLTPTPATEELTLRGISLVCQRTEPDEDDDQLMTVHLWADHDDSVPDGWKLQLNQVPVSFPFELGRTYPVIVYIGVPVGQR